MKLPMMLPGARMFVPGGNLKQKLLRLAFQVLMQGLKVLDRKIRKRVLEDAPADADAAPASALLSDKSDQSDQSDQSDEASALPARTRSRIPVASALPDGTVSVYDEATSEWVQISGPEAAALPAPSADTAPSALPSPSADTAPASLPAPGADTAAPSAEEVRRLVEEAYLRGKNEAIALQWDADLASMTRSAGPKPARLPEPHFPSVWDKA